jgi:hypothetical protein
MYLQRNCVSLSRNHCCNGNATMPSLCVVELPVTLNFIKLLHVAQQLLLWQMFVAGNNNTTSA